MDTVASPPVEPELHLLTDWGQADDKERRRKALGATILFHIAGITILFLLPESFFENKHLPDVATHITPIFEPLTKLTQKAPNTTKPTKEFSAEDRPVRPRMTMPSTPVPAPVRASAPAPTPQPVRQAVIPQPAPPEPAQKTQPLPEPPKVDAAVNAPKVDPQLGALPPPPKIEPQEQPKLALQNLSQGPPPVVPPDQRRVPIPDSAINLHNLAGGTPRPAVPPSGGDSTPSEQLPQLLSDAQGVDFTPYLRQILQTVKRNWQAVMPETVKFGTRGKVSVVLSITRNGQIGKLVFAETSGVESLDRAAVTGVSMSQPFPPLPAEFKGNEIRVQFNFAYNAPKQ
jgi:TonB family protein